MKLLQHLDTSQKVIQSRLTNKRRPIIVSWNLTYKCNLECKYCGYWERKTPELNTSRIFQYIEELAGNGTKFISFTGGEPLLRKDIGPIINECKNHNIHVSLNSNGLLIKKRIKDIQEVDEIQLSIDGPKQINDVIRGRGSFDKVIESIQLCKQTNIKLNISTVISKANYAHIPYMCDLSKRYEVGIYYHPADQYHSGDHNRNYEDICENNEFKKAISYLIEQKKGGHKYINNSLAGLKHLSHWPNNKKIFCFLERVGCFIEPDGQIFICNNFAHYDKYIKPITTSIKDAFEQLALPHSCEQCWCAPIVEFNLLGSFNPESVLKFWNRYGTN